MRNLPICMEEMASEPTVIVGGTFMISQDEHLEGEDEQTLAERAPMRDVIACRALALGTP